MKLIVDIHKDLELFSLDAKFECDNEIIGIMGSSGSGKSMTLKCIAGIEQADSGCIQIGNRIVFNKNINEKVQNRNVGYLFQNYALFDNMTVYENIEFTLKAHKIKDSKKVKNQIKRFHLEGLENRYPRQLSGGQKQRVALARIFVYPPDVLLLDEPFSSLDSELKVELMKDLKEECKQLNRPILFVSHDKEEIQYFTNTIYRVDEGKYEKISC